MASLRDQFKATSTKKLKEVSEDEDSKISSGKGGSYMEIHDGLNKIRLYPKHKGEENFSHISCKHWLTIDGDDGKPRRTTVPNARIHGGQAEDVIDQYIKQAKEILDTGDADDADKLKKLTSWDKGMVMSTAWMAYAAKITKEKRTGHELFEMKKSVRDALNDEAIIEDETEAIELDPFTDPDDGKCILLTYNSKAKKAADYYKVQIAKSPTPLTDEELEAFSKATPLSQLPMFNYGNKEFETALEGLRFFDEAEEIGLFDTETFQAKVEELKEALSSGKKVSASEGKAPAPKKAAPKKVSKEEAALAAALDAGEEEEEAPFETEEETEEDVDVLDQFDAMNRDELKAFKTEHDLDMKIFKNDTDDMLRDKIRELYVTDEDGEEEEIEEEEAEPEEEEAPAPKKAAPKAGAKPEKLTLEQIKENLRKKQGGK